MGAIPVGAQRGPLDARVTVPGSKSVANRAMVCAALAPGESQLLGVPDGDDSAAMAVLLQRLGFDVSRDGGVTSVRGGLKRMKPGPLTLDARLAGTTSRFLTAVAALGAGPYTIDGRDALRRRPMGPLHDALRSIGARVTADGAVGHLPVTICGPVTAGQSRVAVSGDVSSQYISALMLIAPCLSSGLRIELTSPLVSRPYVSITAAVMGAFGAGEVRLGDHEVHVGAGGYTPRSFEIEPDASSASYPLAAAAICGGRVHVVGLTDASLQGDAVFAEILARMGCETSRDAAGTVVQRNGALHGIEIDMADVSDLVPSVAVVAACADSPTTITGVGFIRGKESDRIGDLCRGLRVVGVGAVELSDGLRIEPGELSPARLATHHDHRLAMAFAVLAMRCEGICVDDPDVVSKSWPGFWAMLEGLR
ncbi:MAG: 3-phosphoshikimate 1-carboxyvinyltransferase [Ilumatobacteraceae bacterium]